MSDDSVKLPRSSYEELCKIIKAYGRLTQPASLDEVSRLCVMGKTSISANNSFLTFVELIQGGRAKLATPKGVALAKALEHEIPDQIQENWARVVQENDFLSKMAIAVKIRSKMESSTLESHIAYSAGEAKSGAVMTGARAVVDILRAAGVVRELDGQLVASELNTTSDAVDKNNIDHPISKPDRVSTIQTILPAIVSDQSNISLHIELHIDAKLSELDGLGYRIRRLLREINESEHTLENSDTQDS